MDAAIVYHDLCTRNAIDGNVVSVEPHAGKLRQERFRRVAGEVRKASLLPEDAGIASHAASFALSKVMFKKDAVADGDDVESVLVRTETLLEQGRIDAAAREMNSLQGWAKILSKDWMGDVRRVLEVNQALEVSIVFSTLTTFLSLLRMSQLTLVSLLLGH